jgi:hypothetical protein
MLILEPQKIGVEFAAGYLKNRLVGGRHVHVHVSCMPNMYPMVVTMKMGHGSNNTNLIGWNMVVRMFNLHKRVTSDVGTNPSGFFFFPPRALTSLQYSVAPSLSAGPIRSHSAGIAGRRRWR